MNRIKNFLGSPAGKLLGLSVALILIVLLVIWGLYRKQQLAAQVQHPVREGKTVDTAVTTYGETGDVPKPITNKPQPSPVTYSTSGPREKPLPMSLYTSNSSPMSDRYAPAMRILQCELINTIDSSKIETPIIGRVIKDLVWNDQVIVPAGTEIHGLAQLDKVRDRIATQNQWVLVWNDRNNPDNGLELKLSGQGLAQLPREDGGWQIDDMSAGLPGAVIKTDNLAEIKLFAATLIQGVAAGFTDRQTFQTGFGTSTISGGDLKSGITTGIGAVANQYAQQILDQIKTDGFYVRVPAGSTFYVHVTQTIDLGQGKIGLLRSSEAPSSRLNQLQ